MYAPPPSTAASAGKRYSVTYFNLLIFIKLSFYRSLLPFAALCCLGILGFLIAATIVLALIPVYLPTKDVQTSSTTTNGKFVFIFTATSF
jgi:hypothetical protein